MAHGLSEQGTARPHHGRRATVVGAAEGWITVLESLGFEALSHDLSQSFDALLPAHLVLCTAKWETKLSRLTASPSGGRPLLVLVLDTEASSGGRIKRWFGGSPADLYLPGDPQDHEAQQKLLAFLAQRLPPLVPQDDSQPEAFQPDIGDQETPESTDEEHRAEDNERDRHQTRREELEAEIDKLTAENYRLEEESIRTAAVHRETIEEILDRAAGFAQDLSKEREHVEQLESLRIEPGPPDPSIEDLRVEWEEKLAVQSAEAEAALLTAKTEAESALSQAEARAQEVSNRDRQRVEGLLDEAGKLASRLAESRERIEVLETSLADARSQGEQLAAQRAATEEERGALEGEVEELRALRELEPKLQQTETTLQETEAALQETKDALQETEAALQEQKDRAAKLEAKFEEVRDERTAELQEQLDSSKERDLYEANRQKELEDLQALLEMSQTEQETLSRSLAEIQVELEAKIEALGLLQRECDQARDQLARAEQARSEKDSESLKTQQELGELKAERVDRDVELRQLETDLLAARERQKEGEAAVGRLQDALRKSIEKHADQLQDLTDRVQAAESEGEASKADFHHLQEQSNRQIRSLTEERRDLRASLESAKSGSDEEVQLLRADLTRLQEQLDASRLDLASKRDELESTRLELGRLRDKEAEGSALHEQATRQLAAALKTEGQNAEELSATQTKLAEARQELGQLNADLKAARQDVEHARAETAALRRTGVATEEALQTIKDTERGLKVTAGELQAKVESRDVELATLREKVEQLTQDRTNLGKQGEAHFTELQQARQTIHTLKLDLERTLGEVADLNAQLKRTEERGKEAQGRADSARTELERSLADGQQATTLLQEQKTTIGRLESELTRAREVLSAAETSAAAQQSELEDRKRLSALLKDRESELQTQREARQDLEQRLTETLAKLGNSEDLVEEARLLDSQRIDELSSIREDATSAQAEVEEAKQEAASAKEEARELRSQLKKALEDLDTQAPEPPVHHDPEAERHIAWLQTEIVRANRDSERQLAELASSLRRTEQLLETSSRREQELQQKVRLLEGDGPESRDSTSTSTDDTSAPPSPGRLRPPRW